MTVRIPEPPDTSRISAGTMQLIEQGFRLVQARDMTPDDLQSMDLSDAKIYVAAARNISSTDKTPVPPQKPVSTTETKNKFSKGKKIAVASATALLLLVFAGVSAQSDPPQTKELAVATGNSKDKSEAENEGAVKSSSTKKTEPASEDPAPTPAPPAAVAPQAAQPAPAPATSPTPTPGPQPATPPATPPSKEDCDPNYGEGCVPKVSYDLDCIHIRRTVRVLGEDIHNFDANKDGIGCDSYSTPNG
jgi:hypothetical protein